MATPLPPRIKHNLAASLEGTPAVLSALLAGLPADSPQWDARPDPDRFTLREMLAHLADWETIALGRILRARSETDPIFPDWDENRAAIVGDYAHTSPHESLLWLTERRADTVALIRGLAADEWERPAEREGVGMLDIAGLVTTMAAHDGYHTRQAAEFRSH